MPVSLGDVARNLPLPKGVTAEVLFHLDAISLVRDGKEIGTITRKAIDDNQVAKRLKEILGDSI